MQREMCCSKYFRILQELRQPQKAYSLPWQFCPTIQTFRPGCSRRLIMWSEMRNRDWRTGTNCTMSMLYVILKKKVWLKANCVLNWIWNLKFVQVIFELLRYSSVAPFLVPHVALKDCELGGYRVAKGTEVSVLAWLVVKLLTLFGYWHVNNSTQEKFSLAYFHKSSRTTVVKWFRTSEEVEVFSKPLTKSDHLIRKTENVNSVCFSFSRFGAIHFQWITTVSTGKIPGPSTLSGF